MAFDEIVMAWIATTLHETNRRRTVECTVMEEPWKQGGRITGDRGDPGVSRKRESSDMSGRPATAGSR